MATYTSIPAFTSGQVLTSSVMNDVKNNLDLGNAQSQAFARNLVINGAMQVSQRSTSVAGITTTGYNTADRWQTGCTTLGTWTQSVENDAPTGSGLRKSLKMLCTTADASPAASDTVFIQTGLEGQDLQRIAKGTSSAQAMILTFWVKSNVTGTYTVLIYDNDNNRSVSKSYSISASATWEQKSITIPADTTGAFDNDANLSLNVRFNLGQGSTFTSGALQTTWGTYADNTVAVGQTNLASATSQYWQITGVQLETGSVSTPYEYLPYGEELRRCQRYYFKTKQSAASYVRFCANQCVSSTQWQAFLPFPVEMRASPTVADLPAASNFMVTAGVNGIACTTISGNGTVSPYHGLYLEGTVASGLTTNGASFLIAANNNTAYIGAGAEL